MRIRIIENKINQKLRGKPGRDSMTNKSFAASIVRDDIDPANLKKGMIMETRSDQTIKFKALSIKEPWASRIRVGEKTIETRTWKTKYRGPILICASKLPSIGYAGQAVAIANLVDCRRMKCTDQEAAASSYYPDLYAWVLDKVKKIEPFPVSGKPGLYDIEVKVEVKG